MRKIKKVLKLIDETMLEMTKTIENDKIDDSYRHKIDYARGCVRVLWRKIERIRNKHKIKFNRKFEWLAKCINCDNNMYYWNVKRTNGEIICFICKIGIAIPKKFNYSNKKDWDRVTIRQMINLRKEDKEYMKERESKLHLLKNKN